jgi:hypothetical protein
MNRIITAVSNPVYANSSNSAINCLVTFSDIGQQPYTSSASDNAPYGVSLWNNLQAGTYGAIAAYTAPILTPVQQALLAISTGIVVTCSSNSSLNGIYPIDPSTQVKLNSAITYIVLNNAFPPSNASNMPWYDASGNAHIFTSISSFKAFATAFADFVANVDIYANSNGTIGLIPSNAITIA